MNSYVAVDENMKNSANDKVLKKMFRTKNYLRQISGWQKLYKNPLKIPCITMLTGLCVSIYFRWIRKGFF